MSGWLYGDIKRACLIHRIQNCTFFTEKKQSEGVKIKGGKKVHKVKKKKKRWRGTKEDKVLFTKSTITFSPAIK